MKKQFLFLPLLVLGSSLTALAQIEPPPEPGQIGLSLSTKAFASGESTLKQGDTRYEKVKANGYEIGVSQVFRLQEGGALRFGLEQQATFIDQHREGSSPEVPLPDSLKSVTAMASYTQKVDQNWSWSARASVGSYVAESGLLSDGWGASASFVGIYNQSKATTWMFGLAYNSLLKDLRVLPVVGLIWRPAQQWSVTVGFPKTAVTYRFSRDLSLGLAVSGAGGAYYVEKDPRTGAVSKSLDGSRLQQREIRVGLDATWRVNSSVRLAATVGEVVYRKFEYVDRDLDLKSNKLAPFVSASAVFSF
jgi:hypothetical protein